MRRRPLHLYVSDLDGTLLDNNSQVSSRSVNLLNKAINDGACFTIATARTPATVDVLLEKINLQLPVIVMTGAAMWDTNLRYYVSSRTIADEYSSAVVDIFRFEGLEPFVYCINHDKLDVYHTGELTPEEKAFVDARSGLELKKFHLDATTDQVREARNVVLIFGMGSREHLERIATRIARAGDCSISFYEDNLTDSHYIEVFAYGVSKANAVKQLAAELGATEITVYGDNLNDIPMMEVAGDAVAVDNAVPEVKRAATRTISRNVDDAVALDVVSCNK